MDPRRKHLDRKLLCHTPNCCSLSVGGGCETMEELTKEVSRSPTALDSFWFDSLFIRIEFCGELTGL